MRSRRARQFPGKPSTILADKSVHPWTLERYESLFECFLQFCETADYGDPCDMEDPSHTGQYLARFRDRHFL